MKSDGRLVERNQRLALPEHRSTFGGEDAKLLDAVEAMFRQQGFCPPRPMTWQSRRAPPRRRSKRVLGLLGEHGRLVQVEPGLLFHREAVDRARQILVAHLGKEGRLESVQFKYLLDTTRKFAIPLLDYLDRAGVTRRVGNTRYPR